MLLFVMQTENEDRLHFFEQFFTGGFNELENGVID